MLKHSNAAARPFPRWVSLGLLLSNHPLLVVLQACDVGASQALPCPVRLPGKTLCSRRMEMTPRCPRLPLHLPVVSRLGLKHSETV